MPAIQESVNVRKFESSKMIVMKKQSPTKVSPSRQLAKHKLAGSSNSNSSFFGEDEDLIRDSFRISNIQPAGKYRKFLQESLTPNPHLAKKQNREMQVILLGEVRMQQKSRMSQQSASDIFYIESGDEQEVVKPR